jgi:uncharacterized protein YjaG (DUF416 family)
MPYGIQKNVNAPDTGGKSLVVCKQANGEYRWFGWVSNHFRDRDNPPEILSGKAHKGFVDWADKTGRYPELWIWHVPGSKVGTADWLEFADGFLMASGTFDKEAAGVAERLANSKEEYRMSHGFMRLAFDDKETVTDAYVMFEASVLPVGPEANPWTGFMPVKEGNMALSDVKKAFLAKFLPAETIQSIESNTDALKTAAEQAGVDWKEVEALEETAPEVEVKETVTPEPDVKALAEAVTEQVVKALQMDALSTMVADIKAKADTIAALAEKVAALEATVKELKHSDDEKIAEALTPKAVKMSWFSDAYQASKSADTIVHDGDPVDEALKAAKPSAFDQFVGNLKS